MFLGLPRQFWAGIVYFFAFGTTYGLWGGHVASIEDRIGDSEALFGLALIGAAVGLMSSAPIVGPLSKRFGTANVLRTTYVVHLVVSLAIFWVPTAFVLFLLMTINGFTAGTCDVTMNAQTAVAERKTGKNLLSRAHATWSLGNVFGAGGAWLFLSWGVRDAQIIGTFIVVALLALWAGANLYSKDEEEEEVDQADGAGGASHATVSTSPWLNPILLLMGLLATFGLLIESGMMDWTPIYFSDFRMEGAEVSAAVFTCFAVAMFVVRMLGDMARTYFRDKHLLIGGAFLAGVGLFAGLLIETTALSIAIMALGGVGIAFVYPLVTSRAAAYRAPGQTNASAAGNIAVVTGLGYAAIFVGPPIIGLLSENFSLFWGMAFVAACGPVMALLAMLLPRQRP